MSYMVFGMLDSHRITHSVNHSSLPFLGFSLDPAQHFFMFQTDGERRPEIEVFICKESRVDLTPIYKLI